MNDTSGTTERYWVCWSFKQNCQRIESVADGLRINARAFIDNRQVNHVPIAEFDSQEAANEFLKTVEGEMRSRYDADRDRRDEQLFGKSPIRHED